MRRVRVRRNEHVGPRGVDRRLDRVRGVVEQPHRARLVEDAAPVVHEQQVRGLYQLEVQTLFVSGD